MSRNNLCYSSKLKELRGNRSRQDVANAVGVSRSAIAMYERGERVPKDEVKLRLAKFFNTSVEKIFFAR